MTNVEMQMASLAINDKRVDLLLGSSHGYERG
jgi:hypothetical protein